MKLREFIVTEAIVPEMTATDRDGAIRELVTTLSASGALAADAVDDVVGALIKREQKHWFWQGRGGTAREACQGEKNGRDHRAKRSGHRFFRAGSSTGLQHRAAAEP
jgi:hypothetical protein